MKINITMNEDLLNRVDAYAKEQFTSRSGLISLACTQFLYQREMLQLLRQMTKAMTRISEMGSVDDATKNELNEMKHVFELMSNNL